MTENACASVLMDHLLRRQRRNPHYTLRAFARDLGLNPGTLSAVLARRRGLSKDKATKIGKMLALTPAVQARFVRESVFKRKQSSQINPGEKTRLEDDERHHRILAEWEHYAILTLMNSAAFRSDPEWLAERFGLSTRRVVDVIDRLIQVGLVRRDESGELKKTFSSLTTSEDVSSLALRTAHHEELDLAKAALDKVPIYARDFSSATLVVAESDIPRAKALIRSFRREFMRDMESDTGEQVYALCLQFFPMTQPIAK